MTLRSKYAKVLACALLLTLIVIASRTMRFGAGERVRVELKTIQTNSHGYVTCHFEVSNRGRNCAIIPTIQGGESALNYTVRSLEGKNVNTHPLLRGESGSFYFDLHENKSLIVVEIVEDCSRAWRELTMWNGMLRSKWRIIPQLFSDRSYVFLPVTPELIAKVPPDEFERALKQVLALYEPAIPPVTNNWTEAANGSQPQVPNLEEMKIDMEKMRWILARGVRGEENEMEITENLKQLQRRYFEAERASFMRSDATLSREGREAQLKEFREMHATSGEKVHAIEASMLRTVRGGNFTKDEIQSAFDASAQEETWNGDPKSRALFYQLKEWRAQLNIHDAISNRILLEQEKLAAE